ncbi:MAG TPA: four helix bundle protein [Candidatus Saccharimonadales bacterium]
MHRSQQTKVATKPFDLEDRTLLFARLCRDFCGKLPRSVSNHEYIKQLIRSSASVGANYIEHRESLGSKDRLMRLRISRKETKESIYWLKLVDTPDNAMLERRQELLVEGYELLKILSSILEKSK